MANKYGDRGLWRFIPAAPLPFNPAYRSVWGLMTRREKQASLLIDLFFLTQATILGWIFS